MSKHAVLNSLSIFVLFLAFVLMMGVFYLALLDGNPPIEVDLPVQVDKEEYYPGDTIIMTADFCRNVSAVAEISPGYYAADNSLFYPLPLIQTNLGKGCLETDIISAIPEELPPGRYYRKSEAIYHVNPLAERSASWYTEEFDVLPLPKE